MQTKRIIARLLKSSRFSRITPLVKKSSTRLTMEEFMLQRKIPREIVDRMKEEKIDTMVLAHMKDEELKNYIPKYGDRVMIQAYANKLLEDETNSEDIVNRIKEKLTRRTSRIGKHSHNLRSLVQRGNKNAERQDRRVELGWLIKDGDNYRQIKEPKGGGVKHLKVSANLPALNLLDSAKELFFPNGIAKKGEKLEDYNLLLLDSSHNHVDETMTVSGLYEKLKVKIVRVYMVTCLKEEITSDQTVENIETTPPKAPTVHVLAGTPTISFKVRASTFTTPPDSSSSNVQNHSDDVYGINPAGSDNRICSDCGRTITGMPFCLVCQQDRDYERSLEIDRERNVQSSATSEDFTDIDFLMDSLPDYQDMNLADNLQIMDNESSQPVPSTIEEIRRQRLIFLEGQENRMAPQIETALELNTEERQETLQEILTRLFSKIESDERKNIVNVDRDNVLPGAKRGFQRTSFNENRLLSVRFSGERAIDDGGPTREFIRLAIRSIRDSPIFQGDPHARMLSPDVPSEERGDYKLFGKMLAYFIVIKGTAPVFFSEIMYNALVYGCDACVPTLDDVTDHEMRNQIQKIAMADNNDSFIMATEALIPVIEFIGALPLVTNYANKIQLVHVLCQHIVLTRIKGVLEQFCEGLSCLGLYEELKKYPAVMKTLFVDNKQSLNAVSVDELFDVKFSTVGSNAYMDELRTQTYWRDFLQDLEEEKNGLERILVFVTGFDKVPPLGFEPPLQLLFTHPMQEHEGVPFANTCANQLHIPVMDSFETFKARMSLALDVGITFTNA